MNSRLVVFGAAAAAVVLWLGGGCGQRKLNAPEFVSAPDSVYAGDTAGVRLATSGSGYDSVRYIVRWESTAIETTASFGLLDTATAWHAWTVAGTKPVRTAVYSPADPQNVVWAAQRAIVVEARPWVDSVQHPPIAVRGWVTAFVIFAQDPDGDSIRADITWGDSTDTTTGLFSSPAIMNTYHVFRQPETAKVIVTVQDKNGTASLPDTFHISVIDSSRVGSCRRDAPIARGSTE